mmetsp:Transcript_76419/g.206484  ORF Transcript_76419/g.206484 Transcript_76419/m.206484 type:complete len:247 (-) Transcript_76419:12-752(-)
MARCSRASAFSACSRARASAAASAAASCSATRRWRASTSSSRALCCSFVSSNSLSLLFHSLVAVFSSLNLYWASSYLSRIPPVTRSSRICCCRESSACSMSARMRSSIVAPSWYTASSRVWATFSLDMFLLSSVSSRCCSRSRLSSRAAIPSRISFSKMRTANSSSQLIPAFRRYSTSGSSADSRVPICSERSATSSSVASSAPSGSLSALSASSTTSCAAFLSWWSWAVRAILPISSTRNWRSRR